MRQVRDYSDERLKGGCSYCGGLADSRDHVPSRALLDAPHPPELPVVPACTECNCSFSLDEEYLACLVECVICGSATAAAIKREKVKEIILRKPQLAAKLSQARTVDKCGRTIFSFEPDRVRNVILKLGRGHALFELGEPQLEGPSSVAFAPLETLSPEARESFESPPSSTAWPEVGSRAMQRLAEDFGTTDRPGWVVVQPGRYRYSATVSDGIVVRIVLSEYLGAEVVWE